MNNQELKEKLDLIVIKLIISSVISNIRGI